MKSLTRRAFAAASAALLAPGAALAADGTDNGPLNPRKPAKNIDQAKGPAIAARPPPPVGQIEFGDAQVLTAPMRVTDERALMSVSLNGMGPYDFILDTGSPRPGVLDRIARQLKLAQYDTVTLSSGAEDPKDFPLYECPDFVVGGSLKQKRVGIFGMDSLGEQAVGLVDVSHVTTVDTDLDFAGQQLRLYPKGRGERTGYTKLKSEIVTDPDEAHLRRLVVDAVLDGRPGRFALDTGYVRDVLLFSEAVEPSGLWRDDRPFADLPINAITGTPDKLGRLVRPSAMRIGEFEFPLPYTILRHPEGGRSDEGFDGIIGLGILRRLDLSIDVAGKAIWARHNNKAAPLIDYSRSGVWLTVDSKGRGIVSSVSPGSPAADAGLKTGDVLAPGSSVYLLMSRFRGKAGQVVSFDIEREGGRKTIKLTLRDYL